MADPLKPIIRSEEQKSFLELREQFREDNHRRVHRMLREDTITFRDAAGNYLRDQHGNVIERKTGYLTDRPAGQDHRRVDEWQASGGKVPAFSQEFIIPESVGLVRELRDLDRDAKAMERSEGVKHPEALSMEGPRIPAWAVELMDEEELLKYTERLVKDTKQNNDPPVRNPNKDINLR